MFEEIPDILSHWNYILWVVSSAYGHIIAVMRMLYRPMFVTQRFGNWISFCHHVRRRHGSYSDAPGLEHWVQCVQLLVQAFPVSLARNLLFLTGPTEYDNFPPYTCRRKRMQFSFRNAMYSIYPSQWRVFSVIFVQRSNKCRRPLESYCLLWSCVQRNN
jgi:hypothetical protein